MGEVDMWLLIIATAIIVTYFIFRHKSKLDNDLSVHLKNGKAGIPSKVYKPSEYHSNTNIIAWEFLAPNLSTACSHARSNAGTRKKAQDCPPLPLAECSSDSCLCHYRAVYDSRKQQRRAKSDRRDTIRFGESENRRFAQDRRIDQPDWHDKTLK